MTSAGHPTVLASERVRLEALDPGHADALWRAAAASFDELRPWLMWAVDADPDGMVAFARRAGELWAAGSDYVFAVVHEGAPVGTIGLHRVDLQVMVAELGYWLATGMAGRGLMTEAGAEVARFGFEDLGLHRIELHAAPANVASVRVAEKLGFRREGLLRHSSRGARGWHDVLVFGLLADDPRGPPALGS